MFFLHSINQVARQDFDAVTGFAVARRAPPGQWPSREAPGPYVYS